MLNKIITRWRMIDFDDVFLVTVMGGILLWTFYDALISRVA